MYRQRSPRPSGNTVTGAAAETRWLPAVGIPPALRAVTVAARVGLLASFGVLAFAAPRPGSAVQITAFATALIVVVGYCAAEGPATSGRRFAVLIPYGLGAITATSSAASMTPHGELFVGLSAVAALWAGAGAGRGAGWAVTAWGMAGALAGAAVSGTSPWATVVCNGALPVGGLLLGRNLRAQRVEARQQAYLARQSAALLAQAERLRREQSRSAALDERTRIAREIHDVLAHSLGALTVQIQAAQAVLTDTGDAPRAAELLDQAFEMACDGLSETREAVHALRGKTPPLPQKLTALGASHRNQHGTPVHVEILGAVRPLPPSTSLALTRAAHEALVNAAKHARRQPVEIRLSFTDAHTRLVVSNRLEHGERRDDGPRLTTVNGGYGLAGMRERLLLLGGTLRAGPDGCDWVVAAEVPR